MGVIGSFMLWLLHPCRRNSCYLLKDVSVFEAVLVSKNNRSVPRLTRPFRYESMEVVLVILINVWINLSLCLIKHHAIKVCCGMEVELHTS